MLFSYKECLDKYGSDYQIKKELAKNRLFKIEKGVYSDKEYYSDLELISFKYPEAVFTGVSAYFYYDLTDYIPIEYNLATRRNHTRIKDKNIKQFFVKDNLFEKELTKLEYDGVTIRVPSKERLLVDLIRFKSKIPFDLYKEVINNYRRLIYQLDFLAIEEYAENFKNGDSISDAIQLEVL